MPYVQEYSKLYVTALDYWQHQRHGEYWYIVTNGAMSHTAFTTKRGLERWLAERGLTLPEELPEKQGTFATMPVTGTYRTASHGVIVSGDPSVSMIPGDGWHALQPVVITAAMSNGRYTLALITEEDGVRTVHTLNPNVKDRIQVDSMPGYFIMRELMS